MSSFDGGGSHRIRAYGIPSLAGARVVRLTLTKAIYGISQEIKSQLHNRSGTEEMYLSG